ncbi:MAG: hypothetical protein MPL62_15090, partial [Alphaproteobacteria bacterium]|nr:hypothetical protein [Alphaproteobacteria bacterium]
MAARRGKRTAGRKRWRGRRGGTRLIGGADLVGDGEARAIIREMLQKLKDDGYIGTIRSDLSHDKICVFVKIKNRMLKNDGLFDSLLDIARSHNIERFQSIFKVSDINWLTSNVAVFCMLERFEHISKIFKLISNKSFSSVYHPPDYVLDALLESLDGYMYQGAARCQRLVDVDLRNKIAHNEYWWDEWDGELALQFNTGNKHRKIKLSDLKGTFGRLSLVIEEIHETCQKLGCWYDPSYERDCEKMLQDNGEGRHDEGGGTRPDDGPGLVSDDEARTIIRGLFQRLKGDGYIDSMRYNQKRDEICVFDQSRNRMRENRLLFAKLIQSYKNGNIEVLYTSFGEEKTDLMTLDHALLCLLERFEHIPRTFKMICKKKFFDEEYKKPDYMLGTLLRILDRYLYSPDSRKCRGLVDTHFRNKIAHNEYWQGTKDGKFALQFMAGKRCRKIG